MSDSMSKENRSLTMARIRSSGNLTTELRIISVMHQYGIKGWRRNQKVLGKPDFVFWKPRVAVFVDGCFWHGCPRCKLMPKSNTAYWSNKIKNNRRRDCKVKNDLIAKGWQVIRFWEHSLSRPAWVAKRLQAIIFLNHN